MSNWGNFAQTLLCKYCTCVCTCVQLARRLAQHNFVSPRHGRLGNRPRALPRILAEYNIFRLQCIEIFFLSSRPHSLPRFCLSSSHLRPSYFPSFPAHLILRHQSPRALDCIPVLPCYPPSPPPR